MGWLRRVRSPELWVIPSHPRQAPPPAHYAPRDGISGGPRGTVSQRPCGVMPAWPFVFYCLTVKIGTLGERPPTSPDGIQRINQLWLVTYINEAGLETVAQAKLVTRCMPRQHVRIWGEKRSPHGNEHSRRDETTSDPA